MEEGYCYNIGEELRQDFNVQREREVNKKHNNENQTRSDQSLSLICLLRNLYTGQEATVRTGHGTTDWFQIGKGVHQGCILSPCLFNLYAEYIMRNPGLEEAQAGIKIAGRNINKLICR